MSDEGKQSVDAEGQIWTLAQYTVSMWVPTDDLTKARQCLADKVAAAFPSVMQDAPERYGEATLE